MPVKIGKSQHVQLFHVLKEPLADFDVLLGQDYMNEVGFAIQISKLACTLMIGEDVLQPVAKVVRYRPLRDSLPVALHRRAHAACAMKPREPSAQEEMDILGAWSEYRRTLHAMNPGKQPVYRIMLVQPSESKSTSDQPGERPPELQAVIDKHSGEEGTLCGDIPAGQTATGFEMRIELEPGARPVNIRQFRLTPREEAALVKRG